MKRMGHEGLDRRGFLRAAAAGIALGGGAGIAGAAEPVAVAPPGRRARMATVCQGGRIRKTIGENLEYVMGLLDRALEQKPDLVCLPENFATAGLGGLSARERVEALDGVTLTAASAGAAVNVQRTGDLSDSGWNWQPGRVWLGVAGALTQTPPADGFDVLIGAAVASGRLLLNLQDPLELE